ncbi:hypothetical protein [Amycolatopsis sp. NPDC051128]|uniref:hypothetical protein n=1 Tax=Amycolatopsis sp. NPDC051128 TaxID=3155412 RepID=UPI003417927D
MVKTTRRSAPPPRPRTGRRKSSLPPDGVPEIGKLKQWLREIVGDMPLEQISATCDYSVGAVSNALSGTTLPSLKIARSIAAIGGRATSVEVHKIWFSAAKTVFVAENPEPPRGTTIPDEMLASLAWDLRILMLRWDIGPGDLLWRMQHRVPNPVKAAMSRSTLGRLLKGQTLPTFDQLRAMLLAFGVESDAELSAWGHRHQQIAIAKVLLRDLVRRNPGVALK